jgi:AraC-like DNA-binding protein
MNKDATIGYKSVESPFFFAEYVKRIDSYSMTQNHYHPFYEMYAQLSGERVYFIKDRSYQVKPGDLVFIGPNELHKTMHDGGPGYERLIFHFDDHWLQTTANAHMDLLLQPFRTETRVLRLPASEQAAIEGLLLRSVHELQAKPPGYGLHLHVAAVELALLASRALPSNLHSDVEPVTPIQQKMSDIARYLNEHFRQPLTLDSLSETFYMSPYYISRMFKEVTGFSFVHYLNLIRIKEAQRLLQRTEMKITDVALSVGFDNFSHFGKTFKTITQTTPREYRKRQVTLA